MNKEQIKPLIEKYLEGRATEQESAVVENWYNTYLEEEDMPSADMISAATTRISQRLNLEQDRKTIRLWPRMIAAAIGIMVIGAVLFYYHLKSSERDSLIAGKYANDIAPGKNGATLTLANGKVIKLSDTKRGVVINPSSLAYDDGSSVLPTSDPLSHGIEGSDGRTNQVTASTARGQTYTLTLPDGTKVWLNASTTLRFPSSFVNSNKREVLLSGEAYFMVKHDAGHPFRVRSGKQLVEDIGTEFNINAYPNENSIKTTLLEGSAKVSYQQEEKILIPGHQALNNGKGIYVSPVDMELAVAWKSNKFMFESGDIKSIMRMIERWYDVEVIYVGALPQDTLYGTVSRFDNVSSVLRIMESAGGIHFKIEGRKIYVSR
nr:FecR family protein [Pedobacter sp. ASV19]